MSLRKDKRKPRNAFFGNHKKAKRSPFPSSSSISSGTKRPIVEIDLTLDDSPKKKLQHTMRNSRTGIKKKKIVVNFKSKPKLPADYEEEKWKILQQAIVAVHSKTPVSTGEEELYKATENLCSNKLGGRLYQRVCGQVEKHILSQYEAISPSIGDAVGFLVALNRVWSDHCESMMFIRSILLYLDRTYVIQNSDTQSLWDMGVQMFRKHIVQQAMVESALVRGMLQLIERERNGETVDRYLLKNITRMLVAVEMYSALEEPFLRKTGEYYKRESENKIGVLQVPDYLLHSEKRILSEGERVLHYLEPRTTHRLITLVERLLIQAHVPTLLSAGLSKLMQDKRREDLSRMYVLLERVDCLDQLKVCFGETIRAAGLSIVQDTARDNELVSRLLEYKSDTDETLASCFQNNHNLTYEMKRSFEVFINQRENRPAELIAKYLNSVLQTGSKLVSEDDLEILMDKVMVLFRYINGKDVFEAFFKNDLAKRLLLGKSVSVDAERSMISKLKTECGSAFTNKLEGMFKDIDASDHLLEEFSDNSTYAERMPSGVDFTVQVLTTGFWPAYTTIELKLPSKLAQCQEVYKEFYLGKHNGRRLTYQNTLGHCVLKAKFPKGRKEISVSLFQATILFLFNGASKLTYEDIANGTGLDHGELKRNLQSLCLGKSRILVKPRKGREILEEDVFYWNKKFSSKLFKIRINAIQIQETVEEKKKTREGVFQDRQYQVDAAIVRIMKTRKTLTHNLLVSELFQQLKFPLKPADIKKRIESLIDREYLERDSETAGVYNYLA